MYGVRVRKITDELIGEDQCGFSCRPSVCTDNGG